MISSQFEMIIKMTMPKVTTERRAFKGENSRVCFLDDIGKL